MRSVTSLERSDLCTQTRLAIEAYFSARLERPTEQATKPRTKREARWTVLCHTCR